MNKNRKAVFYGIKDQEVLDTDPFDSFTYYIDGFSTEEEAMSDDVYPVRVYKFKPMNIYINSDRILENLIETLDDEYGNPDGSNTAITENMRESAIQFADAIKSEYRSFMCEKTNSYVEFDKNGKIIKEYDEDGILSILENEEGDSPSPMPK